MDVRTDHDATEDRSIERTEEDAAPLPATPPLSSSREQSVPRPILQEASFLVTESGKIRFFVRPKLEVEMPATLEHIQRFSFTLAPRNRGQVRRVSVGEKRLPNARAHERQWAYVDRVGSAAHVVSDCGPRRYTSKTRGVRNRAGLIEIACGTYAITVHRDHAHLMYELDPTDAVISGALRHALGLGPRASYVAAVFNPESRWRVRTDSVAQSEPTDHDRRSLLPLDPVFLDHEGTELVLIAGDQLEGEGDPVPNRARSC